METINQSRRGRKKLPFRFFLVYIALYPILPSYTRFAGYTAYLWLTIGVAGFLLLCYFNDIWRIPSTYLFLSATIIPLYTSSFLVNREPDRVVFELLEVWLPLTVLLLGLRHTSMKQMEECISVLINVSAVLCVCGIIEFLFSFNVFSLIENMHYPNPNFGSRPAIRYGTIRIEQAFNTALTYALYLMMVFHLTFYRFYATRKKNYLYIMALQCVNIALTFTRGVSLVFVTSIILLMFYCQKEIGMTRVVGNLLTVLLGGVTLCILFPKALDTIFSMFGSAIGLLLGTNEVHVDESSLMRQNFQKAAFNALKSPKVLLFGVGEYGLRDMISIDNEWLLELTGYGVIGTIGFILLLLTPIYYSVKGIKTSRKQNRPDKCLLFKCFLAMFLEYTVSLYTVAQMAEARMFYIMFAIVCMYSTKLSRVGKDDNIGYCVKL